MLAAGCSRSLPRCRVVSVVGRQLLLLGLVVPSAHSKHALKLVQDVVDDLVVVLLVLKRPRDATNLDKLMRDRSGCTRRTKSTVD